MDPPVAVGGLLARPGPASRIVAVSIVVAFCAAAAIVGIALPAADRREPGRTLADDALVYDTLLGYAATHPGWDGVDGVVAGLADRTGYRISLLTEDRRRLAGARPAGSRPAATVDPLRVEPHLAADAQAQSGIDRRAVGPFRLSAAEHRLLRGFVDEQLSCLRRSGYDGTVVEAPNGRPSLQLLGSASAREYADSCLPPEMPKAVASEDGALRDLNRRVLACLGDQRPGVFVLDSPTDVNRSALPADTPLSRAQDCLLTARRAQLTPFVAPPALLFLGPPSAVRPGAGRPGFDALLLAQVAAVTLAAAVAITMVSVRLRRPRWRPAAGAPEPALGRDEIGVLAQSVNALADQHDRLDRERTVLANDIAHELRNPLANIRSWLEAAQDGIQSADRQFVDLLLEEAVILQRVIDDMRDLAAADAGNLAVAPERVYVDDLLTQVVEAHRSAATGAGVTLAVESTADPEWLVDPTRLRQIVGNLVSNAVRHTPSGGSVVVRSTVADAHLVVEVADTGVGIAPDDLPRLFDRFWRADASRSRWSGGSGLGLAIARKLVEAHGGEITVDSRLGAGTVFTVRLPGRPATTGIR